VKEEPTYHPAPAPVSLAGSAEPGRPGRSHGGGGGGFPAPCRCAQGRGDGAGRCEGGGSVSRGWAGEVRAEQPPGGPAAHCAPCQWGPGLRIDEAKGSRRPCVVESSAGQKRGFGSPHLLWATDAWLGVSRPSVAARAAGGMAKPPQGWGWKGNHPVQPLAPSRAVNNHEPLWAACASLQGTPNLGSFTVRKVCSLTVTPHPAGQGGGDV